MYTNNTKYNGEILYKYKPFFKISDKNSLFFQLLNGKKIKSDNKRDVSIIDLSYNNNTINVIVKRFKFKTKLHSFFNIVILKKIKKLFEKNLLLMKKGISVPEPVAYFDNLNKNESFYLSIYLKDSIDFGMYCIRNNNVIENSVSEKLVAIISDLHKNFVIHGDLKWSNIIINNDNIFIIDTEDSIILPVLNKKKIFKDLKRFFRFAIEIGCTLWLKDVFFPEYFSRLSQNIKTNFEYEILYNAALKEFYKKRKGIKPGELFKDISYIC